ncbi:transposase [Variovorax sp. W6]
MAATGTCPRARRQCYSQGPDYSLNAWEALTRNLLEGEANVDYNHCENMIRPWALGRRA